MNDYLAAHLSDAVLLRDLDQLVAQDRLTTATLLARLAEADARRLYVPEGYPSMHAYCVGKLRLSEEAALRRIQAARAARRFPALFTALAEGRLHLTAVCLLAPHLTPENADELIEAAVHRRKFEIEEMLARRFSLPEVPARVRAVPAIASELPQLPPAPVGTDGPASVGMLDEHSLANVDNSQVEVVSPSAERFFLQFTVAKITRDRLSYAQALLSHAVPTGDVAQVFDRALIALIKELDRRKFGAITRREGRDGAPMTAIPRRQRLTVRNRYVPAHVRRAVWERDQGQCTFVSASGHRCEARRFLEFDHVDPVARGGQATVDRMRLRCRAHNQYEAERAFGAGFMDGKRQEARLAAEGARMRAAAEEARTLAAEQAHAAKEQKARSQDVIAGLRGLGCKADEARRAAEFSETLHGATLEERMSAALEFLARRSVQGGRLAKVFQGGQNPVSPPTLNGTPSAGSTTT